MTDIREAFIEFIPLDVKTIEITTMNYRLEESIVTIEQQWLVLFVVLKSEF